MARNGSWLNASRYGWFVVVGALLAGKDACIGGNKRPPVPRVAPTASAVAPTPATPPQNLPPPG